MCTISMITDHYSERWTHPPTEWITLPSGPQIPQSDVDEFYKLLDRAREYDKAHNQPDCELSEKQAALKKIAREYGVEIVFPA